VTVAVFARLVDSVPDLPKPKNPVIVRKMREHIATKPELTHLLIPEPTPLLGPSQIPPPLEVRCREAL